MPIAIKGKNYWSIELRDYKRVCQPNTIRTHDVGRPGHSQRMTCKSVYSGQWITFSWHISDKDVKEVKRKNYTTLQATDDGVKKILDNIRSNHGAIKVAPTRREASIQSEAELEALKEDMDDLY
jgi:hypothetical protein